MSAYLVTTKNAEAFFNAIRTAKAPERFTMKFLKDLDFSSSNDRLFIGVLKGLGFLDENGAPTDRYFAFLDPSRARAVLAESVREAYDDLFAVNRNAQNMALDDVKGKFRTLTQGQKSENVIAWMANTFETLTELADWSETANPKEPEQQAKAEQPLSPPPLPVDAKTGPHLQLHYNIQLILPESRDQGVYDALFASLRRHLL